MRSWTGSFITRIASSLPPGTQCEKTILTCRMPDSLIFNHPAYVASLRLSGFARINCPPCPECAAAELLTKALLRASECWHFWVYIL